MRRHRDTLADGDWVRADRQTKGRGRLGRPWQDAPGNLMLSGLVRPQPGEGAAPELGFVASLALHDLVASLQPAAPLVLKWPNDVLLDGGKLSGILLERDGEALLLGFGVNLVSAPDVPGRKTASLAAAGISVAAAPFAEQLVAAFAARRALWRQQGFAAIRSLWLQRAQPPGTRLLVRIGSELRPGLFAGLAEDGALQLRGADGKQIVVHAGDVFAGE